jgi:hypothetical protein
MLRAAQSAILEEEPMDKQNEKIDVLMAWNAEQDRASGVITKKMRGIPGMKQGNVKKTVLKGLQPHMERRLYDSKDPEGGCVGQLEGLPGLTEELFEAFAGKVPERRKHRLQMTGIVDNTYPIESIPLRNPKKSEPVVSVEVQKAIFPPDKDKPHDGEKVVRSDEAWGSIHKFTILILNVSPYMSGIAILLTAPQWNHHQNINAQSAK